jgi:hypothetical protein
MKVPITQSCEELSFQQDCAFGTFIGLNGQKCIEKLGLPLGVH